MPLRFTVHALLRLFILGLSCQFVYAAQAAEFHVAPGGSDANPGTKAKPFATLEAARNAIRAVKSKSGLPTGGLTVSSSATILSMAPHSSSTRPSVTSVCARSRPRSKSPASRRSPLKK